MPISIPVEHAQKGDVCPYLGLVPKRDQSGQTDKPLSIAKAGRIHSVIELLIKESVSTL